MLFYCVLSILPLILLVLMVLFCAAIRRDSVSLSRFPFFSHVQVLLWEISFVWRLKYSYSCFSSHFCFLVIFSSLDLLVVCIVSGSCDQSSSMLFSVIFELLYRCINVIFNTGKSSSSVFFFFFFFAHTVCQRNLWDIRLYEWSLVFFFSGSSIEALPSLTSRIVPNILHGEKKQMFIPFMRFLLCSLVSSSFLALLKYLFVISSLNSTCLMVSASIITITKSNGDCTSGICLAGFLRQLSFLLLLSIPLSKFLRFSR